MQLPSPAVALPSRCGRRQRFRPHTENITSCGFPRCVSRYVGVGGEPSGGGETLGVQAVPSLIIQEGTLGVQAGVSSAASRRPSADTNVPAYTAGKAAGRYFFGVRAEPLTTAAWARQGDRWRRQLHPFMGGACQRLGALGGLSALLGGHSSPVSSRQGWMGQGFCGGDREGVIHDTTIHVLLENYLTRRLFR